LKIDVSKNGTDLRIKLTGTLDSMTSGDLEETLERELNDNVSSLTFDFSDVDYISSKGIRVLVAAYRKMNGRKMLIENANDSVKEVFRLSGLLKVFTM